MQAWVEPWASLDDGVFSTHRFRCGHDLDLVKQLRFKEKGKVPGTRQAGCLTNKALTSLTTHCEEKVVCGLQDTLQTRVMSSQNDLKGKW